MNSSVISMTVTIVTLAGASCFAQADGAPADVNAPVKLQDYLRLAALNNAGLKAEFERWKAAIQQVRQAQSLADPEFTYEHIIEEAETRVGIMQVFPWFGEIEARTDAAATAANAAKKRYEAKKLELFFAVKEAFYEYVYLASALRIAQGNLELIKHFEQVARTKYMTAAAGHPDVIRAQVELAKAEYQLKTTEQLREPIVARLNAVLNRPNSAMLPWPEKEKLQTAQPDHQRVLSMLKARNPELQALGLDLRSARSAVKLARKKFYPNMGVGVGWMDAGDTMSAGGRDSFMLMFGMNLPIWRDSYRAGELQAEADMRKVSHEKKDAENTLVARAEQALYDFEDSLRKMRLYSDVLIPKAKQLLGASEIAYKTGAVDFLSLIDAQQGLLSFQLDYERALADNQQKLAELEMLVGEELTKVDGQVKEEVSR